VERTDLKWLDRYKLWLEVFETGGGWFVERDGRTVAVLVEPRFSDMFWYTWRIVPLAEDEAERAALFSQEYWDGKFLERTKFRSREYGCVAEAFWGGREPVWGDRLIMRSLYQPIRSANILDSLVLWAVRRWKNARPRRDEKSHPNS
jgi:hypothetical protein